MHRESKSQENVKFTSRDKSDEESLLLNQGKEVNSPPLRHRYVRSPGAEPSVSPSRSTVKHEAKTQAQQSGRKQLDQNTKNNLSESSQTETKTTVQLNVAEVTESKVVTDLPQVVITNSIVKTESISNEQNQGKMRDEEASSTQSIQGKDHVLPDEVTQPSGKSVKDEVPKLQAPQKSSVEKGQMQPTKQHEVKKAGSKVEVTTKAQTDIETSVIIQVSKNRKIPKTQSTLETKLASKHPVELTPQPVTTSQAGSKSSREPQPAPKPTSEPKGISESSPKTTSNQESKIEPEIKQKQTSKVNSGDQLKQTTKPASASKPNTSSKPVSGSDPKQAPNTDVTLKPSKLGLETKPTQATKENPQSQQKQPLKPNSGSMSTLASNTNPELPSDQESNTQSVLQKPFSGPTSKALAEQHVPSTPLHQEDKSNPVPTQNPKNQISLQLKPTAKPDFKVNSKTVNKAQENTEAHSVSESESDLTLKETAEPPSSKSTSRPPKQEKIAPKITQSNIIKLQDKKATQHSSNAKESEDNQPPERHLSRRSKIALVSLAVITTTLVVIAMGVWYKKLSFHRSRYAGHMLLASDDEEFGVFNRMTYNEDIKSYQSWKDIDY